MTRTNQFPIIDLSLRRIEQAAEGLTGIGMVLSALLVGGEYETPEDRLVDNQRLVGGLYAGIETLAWVISLEGEGVKEMLEKRFPIEE